MSRFPRRACCALLGAVVLVLAGCGNPTAMHEPDLLQALPAPSPPPTAVPTPSLDDARSSDRGPTADRDEWRLVFSDDFDSRLDPQVWNRYNSVGGFGNGWRRPEAITTRNGALRITARGDVSGGMNHEHSQTYGRWEFRARTEKGRGRGSAILLWPDSLDKEADGELDMMEVPREDRSQAHFVIHYSAQNKLAGNKVSGDFSQWHTFAMDWLPDRITWYVDGVKQFETTDRNVIPTSRMHLAIQLDMGPYEEWILAPDHTTPAEVSLEVDWVRVYARR
ncbi:glycoside hydrolase family 16 protein [Pseudonocardia sichuanensis]|uniref:Beta-glucanase (GH16 family) n=1 Tax=Pseudonocardia kunmingensis TaxID=630975 RepID=A0A543DQT3_9PSEU|nr:glycoside hydrolase family 16 protein [Pseudonocardia kunmingensis]TQM11680.1 beta-glucanase (GH16 family) [Pseudonocardia kunmingensis]